LMLDCGLWIAGCGLRAVVCGLRIADCGLRILITLNFDSLLPAPYFRLLASDS
jgi:hypothetical protein